MTNPFAAVARFAKQADPMNAYQADMANKIVSNLGQMALLSLGTGAAARGGVGLLNMAKRNINPPKPRYPAAVVTKVPYPVESDEDDGNMGQPKFAAFAAGQQAPWWYFPSGATQRNGISAYYPAMAGIGMAGIYGGWKGVDALLDRRRVSEQESELDNAKKDFETALVGSYRRPRREVKLASDATDGEKLGAALDDLFDALTEKQANLSDIGGATLGGYLGMYALPTSVITGMLAYNRAKKTNQRTVLEKAMKQRLRRNYMTRPSEMLAVPTPVRVGGGSAGGEEPTAPSLGSPNGVPAMEEPRLAAPGSAAEHALVSENLGDTPPPRRRVDMF